MQTKPPVVFKTSNGSFLGRRPTDTEPKQFRTRAEALIYMGYSKTKDGWQRS